MAKRKTISSKLFEMFTGELVSIWVKKDMKELSEDIRGGVKNFSSPGVLAGFLNEEDDEYFFLGHTPADISFAVKKNEIIQVGLLEQDEIDTLQEQAEALNNAVETPKKNTGVN